MRGSSLSLSPLAALSVAAFPLPLAIYIGFCCRRRHNVLDLSTQSCGKQLTVVLTGWRSCNTLDRVFPCLPSLSFPFLPFFVPGRLVSGLTSQLQRRWGSTKDIMNNPSAAAKFRDAARAHFCEELYKVHGCYDTNPTGLGWH